MTNHAHVFLDVETTGIPRDYRAKFWDVGNWPRVVEIAWSACGAEGEEILTESHLVKPDGFRIPADATRIHGITADRARSEGVDLGAAITPFVERLGTCAGKLVAHNLEFDRNVIGAEMCRLGYERSEVSALLFDRPNACTMREAAEYCRIPGSRGRYKWPTLDELHLKLFGARVEGGHRALADVRATARCFFRLRELEVIA
jgi:DNA polymerase III epsilon subunit-like protein